jgi:PAS domain S-box-containing protein
MADLMTDSVPLSKDALQATVEFAPLGIAHFDPDGRVCYANPRLCEILGFRREELLGGNFFDITFADDLPECVALTQRVAAGEIPSYRHEKRFVRADGSVAWACVSVSGVRDAAGGLRFLIGIAEDISEQRANEARRRAAEIEQVEALRAAEEAKRMRDDMVAIVAHDLRNPVHTITLAAAMLRNDSTTAEQQAKLVSIVQQTAANMSRLLDDLLDVSRMDSGTFALSPARVDSRELLACVVEQFEARAGERGIALSLRPDDCPVVRADRDRLMQVLSNLVGNSLKFTPEGGRVELSCTCTDEGAQFAITDSGPGIEPEDLPKLFDRFWKADPASPSGAGLGLAIARGIVEAHGGRIWAESFPGHGTTMRFTVPD